MVILLMGWEGLGGIQTRLMAVLAVVLAGFLAWLGRFTPSALPAVLLHNLNAALLLSVTAGVVAGNEPLSLVAASR